MLYLLWFLTYDYFVFMCNMELWFVFFMISLSFHFHCAPFLLHGCYFVLLILHDNCNWTQLNSNSIRGSSSLHCLWFERLKDQKTIINGFKRGINNLKNILSIRERRPELPRVLRKFGLIIIVRHTRLCWIDMGYIMVVADEQILQS